MMGSGSDPEDEGGMFAEINVTPLTDVFLVLLIIFMVVTSVDADQGKGKSKQAQLPEEVLEIQTPRGGGDSQIVRKDVLVSITPDGRVFVDEQEVGFAALAEQLRQRRKAEGPVPARVVVRGDETAQYSQIMKVLTAAGEAGFDDLALATRGQ